MLSLHFFIFNLLRSFSWTTFLQLGVHTYYDEKGIFENVHEQIAIQLIPRLSIMPTIIQDP